MRLSTVSALVLSTAVLSAPLRRLPREVVLPNTGNCGLPEVTFVDEGSSGFFNAGDQADFFHSPNENITIIADFICDTLDTHCDAPASTVAACQMASLMAEALVGRDFSGGQIADAFNIALNISTDFTALTPPPASSNSDGPKGSKDSKRAAADTGSCGSPEIEFANGLDGRKEPAFEPVNQKDFNHGSALNIGIIANFICGQLSSKCQASAATVQTCNQAASTASGLKGGAAADAFNAAFGIKSNFAAVKARELVHFEKRASSGSNLQKFKGSLGATAPPVQVLANGQFQVEGNASFKELDNSKSSTTHWSDLAMSSITSARILRTPQETKEA